MSGQWKMIVASILAAGMFAGEPAFAASTDTGANKDKSLQDAGDGVAIALPLVAGGLSLYKDDWNGVGQLAIVTLATVGSSYAIDHLVREERPYCEGHIGCNDRSFPSNTAALAFAPAQYLWNRYGWEYGVPAYAAAGFVGATRIISSQHHWWDVATSGLMAWGYNWAVTSRYHAPDNLYTGLYATPHAAFVSMKYTW